MPTWNPAQYLQFGDERLRPALDLLARIPSETPDTVYDLGCGPGTATVLLEDRWPDAQITGLDSSDSMLERARDLDSKITWRTVDLSTWEPNAPADVLFSNAVFHWLDGHGIIFPRLMSALNPGGVLAIQMPNNFSEPSHTSITETIRNGPWREQFESGLREFPVEDASTYYDLLSPHASHLDIWETTYSHILSGENPVVEWTKGSALRPFLDQLDEDHSQSFLDHYSSLINIAYTQSADGNTVLPFKRVFIIAVK